MTRGELIQAYVIYVYLGLKLNGSGPAQICKMFPEVSLDEARKMLAWAAECERKASEPMAECLDDLGQHRVAGRDGGHGTESAFASRPVMKLRASDAGKGRDYGGRDDPKLRSICRKWERQHGGSLPNPSLVWDGDQGCGADLLSFPSLDHVHDR